MKKVFDEKFLIRKKWEKKDVLPFQEYLKSLSKGKEKAEWEQRIVNTSLPCLAVPSDKVKEIVNKIAKGNFIDFINLWLWENHTNTTINGGLICKIKDFKIQKEYLKNYAQKADNWATIDCLKFKFNKENKSLFLDFAKELLEEPHTFSRRLGVIILLKLCTEEIFIDEILSLSTSLFNETEYYVNMANAWLIAECFTNHKDKTMKVFEQKLLNKFTNNKAISKCRDSFRVSKEDKEMLLNFRQK